MIGNELIELAMQLSSTAADDDVPEGTMRSLQEHAFKLNAIALRVQALENIIGGLGLEDDSKFPTAKASLALGRFMGQVMRDDRIEADHASAVATVTRGGAGLSNDYLLVQLGDGYTGGIDREGRVST